MKNTSYCNNTVIIEYNGEIIAKTLISVTVVADVHLEIKLNISLRNPIPFMDRSEGGQYIVHLVFGNSCFHIVHRHLAVCAVLLRKPQQWTPCWSQRTTSAAPSRSFISLANKRKQYSERRIMGSEKNLDILL